MQPHEPLTVAAVLANEDLRRHEFPVVGREVFLAHAAVCPLPRRVAEAIRDYAAGASEADQERALAVGTIRRTREMGAQLLGASPEEIALVGPTSLGLSFIAAGLEFKRHQHVLVYHDDYPSNVYPWMALADRGVAVRFLNTRGLGVIRPVDVLGQVDEGTRLVALASCHFISGFRVDLETVGRQLRERGILFAVDGIQTLGAFPFPPGCADFVAADAHKWLLGPCGAGLLYVRREAQDSLQPTAFGWHNVRSPNFVAQDDLVLQRDARRYEAGSHPLLGIAGLAAGLELLLEVGIAAIAEELLRKRHLVVDALQAKGYQVLVADSAKPNRSAIVSFRRQETDMAALHQRLADTGIQTSLRTDRAGQRYLRFAPHFYNTDTELLRAVEAV